MGKSPPEPCFMVKFKQMNVKADLKIDLFVWRSSEWKVSPSPSTLLDEKNPISFSRFNI